VPFVRVYTKGINDVNYIVPFFGLLITLANAMHCLRLPYNIMILAGGHYKQTQANYIVASVSNIVISIITVKFWGLVGVAIGTLVAMSYQTVWMAWYDSKNFLNLSLTIFIKHITVDAMCFVTGYVISSLVEFSNISYFSWFVMAIKVGIIWMTIVIVFNIVFYKEFIIKVFSILLKKYKGDILCKAQ
jgi:Na+/glutamate symporter